MHPSLPQSLSPELLGSWLVNNAKEKYTEEKKIYYTEEELLEFKNTAVASGIEINNLSTTKASVSKHIEDGKEEELTIDLPITIGIKALKAKRENCEKEVEKGYRVENIKIFGIPNERENTMDFFDIEGNLIPERSRSLSAKEVREYFGMFANQNLNIKLA